MPLFVTKKEALSIAKITGPVLIYNLLMNISNFIEDGIISSHGYAFSTSLISPMRKTTTLSATLSLSSLQYLLNEPSSGDSVNLVRDTLYASYLYGMLMSILTIAIQSSYPPTLSLLNFSSTEIENTKNYFYIYGFSMPATLLLHAQIQLLISKGFPYLAVPIGGISAGLELILLAYLIENYGFSVSIIAYARLIQAWATLMVSTATLTAIPALKRYHLIPPGNFSIKKKLEKLKKIFKLSIPIFLEVGGEISASIIISILLGKIGKDQLNSYSIGTDYMTWILLLTSSISVSSSTYISKLKDESARKIILVGSFLIFLAITLSTVLSIPFFIFQEQFLTWFIPKELQTDSLVNYTQKIVPLRVSMSIPLACRKVSAGSLRGVGNTALAMFINLIGSVGIGAGLATALYFTNFGSLAMIWADFSGITGSAVVLFSAWLWKGRKEQAYRLKRESSASLEETAFLRIGNEEEDRMVREAIVNELSGN